MTGNVEMLNITCTYNAQLQVTLMLYTMYYMVPSWDVAVAEHGKQTSTLLLGLLAYQNMQVFKSKPTNG